MKVESKWSEDFMKHLLAKGSLIPPAQRDLTNWQLGMRLVWGLVFLALIFWGFWYGATMR